MRRRRSHGGVLALAGAIWLILVGAGNTPQDLARLETIALEFGVPEPGRHVYSRPGLLSEEQEQLLQREAAVIERSGLKVIIYLRIYEATYAETQRDAAELLEGWQIESEPGARDGVVIFANMRVSNPAYGWVALAGGAGAARERALTPDKLRESRRWMIPGIVRGDMPAGIVEGLRQLAYEAQFGPTPRQDRASAQSSLANALRGPLAILAAIVSLGLGALGLRVWSGRFPNIAVTESAHTPTGLTLRPALRAALRDGRVTSRVTTAAIVDLAERGDLAIEPAHPRHVRVQLLSPTTDLLPHETAVWSALAATAGTTGEVSETGLSLVSKEVGPVSRAVRVELEGNGWFDPAAPEKRGALALAGALGITCAITFALLAVVSRERWGLVSASVIATVSLVLLFFAPRYPATTRQGRAILTASRLSDNDAGRDRVESTSPGHPLPSDDTLARLETVLAGGRPD
ncbi:MAG: DUF2207 domain-containing protein [Chloroflexota bacterium]|nr:DUF2207 domain-containing protein [Chloroflexota bacterium]